MKYRDLDRKLGRKRTPFCHPLDGSRPCLPIGRSRGINHQRWILIRLPVDPCFKLAFTNWGERIRRDIYLPTSTIILLPDEKNDALYFAPVLSLPRIRTHLFESDLKHARELNGEINIYIYIYKVKISSVISSIFLCVKRVLQSRLEFVDDFSKAYYY